VEFKEKYQVEILNRFAALENLIENTDIRGAWECIRIQNVSDKVVWLL
jgi:hypothetical protein